MVAFVPVEAPGNYNNVGLVSTFVAGTAGADTYPSVGRELVVARNDHATVAQTVTIASQPDSFGRVRDITAFSIPAVTSAPNNVACFGPIPAEGWRNSSGNVTITTSTTDVKIWVIRLPRVS